MSIAIHERLEDEEGFTLIELLVVVIIIGILAAIAIPTFLSQRERGWQAELTSAVRNAAIEIESQGTAAGGVYPPTTGTGNGQAIVDTFEDGKMDLVYIKSATAPEGFCIGGDHNSMTSGTGLNYISKSGGLQTFTTTGYTVLAACA